MLRSRHAALVLATLFACRGDSGPTSPSASTNSIAGEGTLLSADPFADDGDARGPHDSNVTALITFTAINGRYRPCQGVDAFYIENHPNYTGTVSGDPRLNGTIEMNIIEVVRFGEDGNVSSPSTGPFRIRDASGRVKAEGQYSAWFENNLVQGMLVGQVADAGSALGGLLLANLHWVGYDNGALGIVLGGPTSDTKQSAGIWGGKCTGKWNRYDDVIPPPPTTSALLNLGAPRAVPWWQALPH